MTYEQVVESRAMVTRDEARREIERHGQTWEAWLADHADRDEYRAATVLAWLGY